ncbi:hypothetical protein OIDMADRAFT_110272, partial [Oidiodendron maius Zn]
RIGKIELRAFLFQRRVPEVNTPLCCCSITGETPAHIVLYCPELQQEREELQRALLPHPPSNHPRLHSSNGRPSPVQGRW